ncbi:MAG: hypothetical protein COX57_01875 [Alphaproteobacteria bacterium CG_4_10_14_0_2_um_filter_63_37]|nr:MAG: hypothetical protein AUJ55_10890 [Proteobacteria bacterium CG1_02_64_396]PJA25756.1 MAG: hypothetical protein COX57_01875 [Alphaproteobacteria bacterium CG_4_10_14_0_2_um_filter_63_37]
MILERLGFSPQKGVAMKLTELLRQEHRTIERMLNVLDHWCVAIRGGEPVDGQAALRGVGWLVEYADHWHHHKEEQLLFSAMEAAGVPREGGPLGVMLFEHDNGRKYLEAMGAAAQQIAAGERGGGEAFCRAVRQYTFLIGQHILKEDRVLYPMAEARIDSATAHRLGALVEESWIVPWTERLQALERQLAGWEEGV